MKNNLRKTMYGNIIRLMNETNSVNDLLDLYNLAGDFAPIEQEEESQTLAETLATKLNSDTYSMGVLLANDVRDGKVSLSYSLNAISNSNNKDFSDGFYSVMEAR